MHGALLITLALLGQEQDRVNADLTKVMKPLAIRYTGGGYKDKEFRYRLYVPPGATSESPASLIIWLHGLSHSGSDNVAQLAAVDRLLLPGGIGAVHGHFVLAPQCPADNPRWTMSGSRTDDDMINVVA